MLELLFLCCCCVTSACHHTIVSCRVIHFSLKVQLESLYRSYYAQVGLPPGPRLVPPMKRPRIHGPATTRPPVKAPSPNKSSHTNNNATTNNTNASSASLTDLKTYSKFNHKNTQIFALFYTCSRSCYLV